MSSSSFQFPATVRDCIEYGAQQFDSADLFFGHGTDNAQDEAFWLVFYALSLSFDADESTFDQSVSADQWADIECLFSRRVTERVPAAYLTGEGWFCGYPFTVNDQVLVPRSPIAELIQQQFQPWFDDKPLQILDLCTGCGCIGIASALTIPEVSVDLTDISTSALAVAQQNIQRHDLSGRVEAIQSDLFSALTGKKYDLIVTNPPYVDANDLSTMPAEYQAEPAIALGSGDDGLDITRRLLREAADYLSPNGIMVVEVGNSWVNLEAAFPKVPFLWLEFASGGHGVFLIRRDELIQYQAEFV
jgi:ribosomal protein L3 glutamine methyltransferase